MAVTSGVGQQADGRPVVVKEAGPGADAEGLRAEAQVLEAAAHPGVVGVLDLVELPDGGVRLTTAFAGGHSLRRARNPAALLTLLAATASTLADLHARGVVHGALDADHVLVSASDRTLLCGFAPGPSAEASADVTAFGLLVAEVVREGRGPDLDELRRIAQRAGATPAPTMASVATMLDALLSPAPAARAPRRPKIPASTVLAVAGTLAGVLAAALVVTLVLRGAGGSGEQATPTTALPRAITTTGPPAELEPSTSCPAPEARGATAADVDGDGCTEAVTVANGVVEAGGDRWLVGAPSDVVTVGDWDCDGTATAALVRPATGEAWLFEAWPAAGEEGAGRPLSAPPGTVDAAGVDPDGDGCPELQAIDAGGARTPLDVSGAA